MFPGSHRQKICIVDEQVGFCGGLDVNKGRVDTQFTRCSGTTCTAGLRAPSPVICSAT